MSQAAATGRYDVMPYRRCGASGLQLPAISFGLWHNFGARDDFDHARALVRRAFDHGITHFDLANNYGPPPGSAETVFGRILAKDLRAYRDELVIATKAGFRMQPGPYGDGGSRKYLLDSLDRSLERLGLDHVDIYYHHRPDPETPLEETTQALADAVRSGRARYVGLSNYPPQRLREAIAQLRALGAPCLIAQHRYNLLDREVEHGVLEVLADQGVGGVAYSPLAQGMLSERYLGGTIPADSRAAGGQGFLRPEHLTPELLHRTAQLARIAQARGQTLAQLALTWVLRQPTIASVLIGASHNSQIDDAVAAVRASALADDELAQIACVLQD